MKVGLEDDLWIEILAPACGRQTNTALRMTTFLSSRQGKIERRLEVNRGAVGGLAMRYKT
jgi:hypothetical protein